MMDSDALTHLFEQRRHYIRIAGIGMGNAAWRHIDTQIDPKIIPMLFAAGLPAARVRVWVEKNSRAAVEKRLTRKAGRASPSPSPSPLLAERLSKFKAGRRRSQEAARTAEAWRNARDAKRAAMLSAFPGLATPLASQLFDEYEWDRAHGDPGIGNPIDWLAGQTRRELLRMPNVGKKKAAQIDAWLASMGYSLQVQPAPYVFPAFAMYGAVAVA